MLNLAARSAVAWRSVKRMAAGMATAVDGKIGDTKVPMSLLEKGAYINYQRIEDNLAVVRQRYAPPCFFSSSELFTLGLGYSAPSRCRKKSCMVTWTTLIIKISPVVSATSSSGQM